MGIPLLSGREFKDREDAAGMKAAMINKTLASQLWPGGNPVGKIVTVKKVKRQIVGVVQDSRYGSVWATTQPCIYTPYLSGKLRGAF